jgi:ABC-type transport system substrate-binding protein
MADNYWMRYGRARVSRRRFAGGVLGAGAGVAALAAVGCGDDDDEPSSPAGSASAAATTAAPATATKAVAKRGGISVTQSANVYETVDPHRTVASPVLQVLAGVQSKILRFSNPNTGEVVGDLAEKWESPDPQTVVLSIRQGVTWHSKGPGAANPAAKGGRALTAQDIVYNIERQ